MPSPFYRPASGPGRSGPGVSADGYDGAESFFEQVNTVAGQLKVPFLPNAAEQSAAAKAALDAYMTARNGTLTPNEALFYNGKVDGAGITQIQTDGVPGLQLEGKTGPVDHAQMADIGKAVNDLMSNMGDMFNQLATNPMGFLSNLLSFLFKLFTEVASGIGEALSEAARAAASAVEDAWKKQMEMAANAANQAGLQPLELYNQAASTQMLSTALKSGAST